MKKSDAYKQAEKILAQFADDIILLSSVRPSLHVTEVALKYECHLLADSAQRQAVHMWRNPATR